MRVSRSKQTGIRSRLRCICFCLFLLPSIVGRSEVDVSKITETYAYLKFSSCTNVRLNLPEEYSNWVAFYALGRGGDGSHLVAGRSSVLLVPEEIYYDVVIVSFQRFEGGAFFNGITGGPFRFCLLSYRDNLFETSDVIEPSKIYILDDVESTDLRVVSELSARKRDLMISKIVEVLGKEVELSNSQESNK